MTCKDRERTEAHEEMETMRRMKGACEGGREGGRGKEREGEVEEWRSEAGEYSV